MTTANVLVIDDDYLVRQAACRVLVSAGYNVEQCASGEAALELAGAREFDAAICDFRLPGIDGVTVLQRLREVQNACVRILMTGMLDVPTAVNAVNTAAITHALQKPMSPKELVAAVGEALSSRDEMRDSRASAEREVERREREELSAAIAGEHIKLALQPIVRADGSGDYGYEGLLRSSHPVFNGPGTVLPAVETHDLVGVLADRVASCGKAWLERLPQSAHLFLNLHPRELAHPGRLSERMASLAPWAERVVLEITERSTLEDVPGWERAIAGMVERGFSIAVDDLGSGYSSLAVMADLQPRYIKIDMSIVRDVHTRPHKQRLVDLLCKFAEATGATVVGEGVETREEADALRDAGVHLLQGYFFGRPSLEGPSGITAAA